MRCFDDDDGDVRGGGDCEKEAGFGRDGGGGGGVE